MSSDAAAASDEITLTRALVKLKTLDKKIQAAIDQAVFVSYKGELAKPDAESVHASKNYQSILDLIAYRRALKSAVITSNAQTKVVINGKEQTVAEAIEEKKSIKHKKHLLTRMRSQYSEALRHVEDHNQVMRSNLENDNQRSSRMTRSASEEQSRVEFSADYNKSYMKMHGLELYDPLAIRTKIETIDNYITRFMDEVDQALSEINATTKITVPCSLKTD